MTTTQQPDSLAGEVLPDYDDHHDEFPPPPGAPALRATAFFQGSAHPDAPTTPCPQWCDYPRHGTAHGIERGRPIEHGSTRLETRASLYRGEDRNAGRDGERHVFASIETYVEMVEGHPLEIRVGLRDYPWVEGKGTVPRYRERLKLTPEDAAELAAMLTYWSEVTRRPSA